ncbi:MAG: hypothetical protein IJB86_00810 [Clostridia bacterium]|nr:hypothetical protein [Clostridia bacterium]
MNKKYESVNPFILFVFFIAAVIISLPLRVFQLMQNVEANTGFWINRDSITVYILYAVLGIGIVLPILLSLIYKRGLGKTVEVGEKKLLGGIFSFILSATLIVNAITRYGDFSDAFFSISNSANMFSELSKSGGIAMVLEAFFAVVSAIFFIMYGIAQINGKSASEYKLLAIMPLFWSVFRILHRFMREISFLNVSELFLELLMIAFLLMFFMAFAQVTAKVNGKGVEWKLFAYGLPAALLCLLCFVPRVIVTILGKGEFIYALSSIEFCDLGVALFIIYVLVDRSKVFKQEILEKKNKK